jgi:hypothetical protein
VKGARRKSRREGERERKKETRERTRENRDRETVDISVHYVYII